MEFDDEMERLTAKDSGTVDMTLYWSKPQFTPQKKAAEALRAIAGCLERGEGFSNPYPIFDDEGRLMGHMTLHRSR